MIMDGLETLTSASHAHPFLLSEAAAAAAHRFSVLSFDSVLYRSVETATGAKGGASPQQASGVPESVVCPLHGPDASDAIPADLNTPVTTSGDVPTFFGPSTVVEPPPITGKCSPPAPTPSSRRPFRFLSRPSSFTPPPSTVHPVSPLVVVTRAGGGVVVRGLRWALFANRELVTLWRASFTFCNESVTVWCFRRIEATKFERVG
ncbi:hypothetical protein V9T40_014730 [Parthenolecanium corni]|uniref:Uncharacterized protein n=1 Tax=Parthenolecanium corni TaxID=536013 RepID=A0AAN9T2P6_9HEMI